MPALYNYRNPMSRRNINTRFPACHPGFGCSRRLQPAFAPPAVLAQFPNLSPRAFVHMPAMTTSEKTPLPLGGAESDETPSSYTAKD